MHYSDGPLGAGQLDGRGVKGVGRHLLVSSFGRSCPVAGRVSGRGWVALVRIWGGDGRTVPVRFVLHVTFSEDAVCAELVLRQVGRCRRRNALIAMKTLFPHA